MSKKVSLIAKYECLGFFSKFFTKCFSKKDVDSLSAEYDDKISKLEAAHLNAISACKTELDSVTKEKDACISNLETKNQEATSTSGRNAANREATITGLKEEINELKQKNKDIVLDHKKAIDKLNSDHTAKINGMSKKCADGILKADKKAKKEASTHNGKNGKPGLVKDQVIDIFKRGNAGEDRLDLAKEFKSNKTTIGRIITGKSYTKFTKDIKIEKKKESK